MKAEKTHRALGYAKLTKPQLDCLKGYVAGKVVFDLGSGTGEMAEWAARYAEKVYAVDYAQFPTFKRRNVEGVQCEFHRLETAGYLLRPEDVIVVSWPCNCSGKMRGLVDLLQQVNTVIYIGSNTDGNACGDNSFWVHVSKRWLKAEIADQANTLIVYGQEAFEDIQFRSEEELLGLMANGMFNIIKFGALRAVESGKKIKLTAKDKKKKVRV